MASGGPVLDCNGEHGLALADCNGECRPAIIDYNGERGGH